MALSDFFNTITREKTFTTTAFRIAPDRILRTDTSRETKQFIPRATYFELRLTQMFIQFQREYWRDFIPMASMMTEFIFAGQRQVIPFIVGPERLASAQQVARGDQVEYYNTRVAGPYPYQGDDVSLFAGLFRVEVNNWARRTLSLFETVAEAFDPTRLSSYLNIARPLLTGLEGFLGMKEVEMRLGRQKAYMQQGSATMPADDTSSDLLQPAFEVHLRDAVEKYPPQERRKFWVVESRLFYGDSERSLRPYTDADFMLIRFVPLAVRNDYTTFDFHKLHWKAVEENFANGDEEAAKQAFRLLAVSLAQSDDIVDAQRRALVMEYRNMYAQSRDLYMQLFEPTREALRSTAIPESMPRMSDTDAETALQHAAMASMTQAQNAPTRILRPEDVLRVLDV